MAAAAALTLAAVPGTPILQSTGSDIPSETNLIRVGADYWPSLLEGGTSATDQGLSFRAAAGAYGHQAAGRPNAVETARSERDRRVSAASVSAVDDLAEWLHLTDSQVAQLGNVSRRTLGNWRNAGGAYGSSSRHLLAVHAFVSQLVAVQGIERTRLWLALGTDDGTDRVARIGQGAEGLRHVLALAEPLLFPTLQGPRRLVDDEDLEAFGQPGIDQVSVDQNSAEGFVAPPRRPRTIST